MNLAKQIGYLTILEEYPDKRLKCKCDCGKVVIRSRSLLYNGTKNSSCGCKKGVAIAIGKSSKFK